MRANNIRTSKVIWVIATIMIIILFYNPFVGFSQQDQLDTLIKQLKDEKDWFVRQRAAETLGDLDDERAIEPLITTLKDEYLVVRGAAESALEKITGENFGLDQAAWQKWWEKNKNVELKLEEVKPVPGFVLPGRGKIPRRFTSGGGFDFISTERVVISGLTSANLQMGILDALIGKTGSFSNIKTFRKTPSAGFRRWEPKGITLVNWKHPDPSRGIEGEIGYFQISSFLPGVEHFLAWSTYGWTIKNNFGIVTKRLVMLIL